MRRREEKSEDGGEIKKMWRKEEDVKLGAISLKKEIRIERYQRSKDNLDILKIHIKIAVTF
jgi:hypothetical protein